jgi:hypothetical protein
MGIQFSDTSNNTGIVQQSRVIARVDSTQWPTARIVNSANNWMDELIPYLIARDKRFRWDDTNHTKLPIGTSELTLNTSYFSFITDEQGNRILNLLRIEAKDANGEWHELKLIDENDIDVALDEYKSTAGTPEEYMKVSDNVIRVFPQSATTVAAGIRYYFQRVGSYFTASDTTKEPGVAAVLHRGFVIASAYDCALTLGLDNLEVLRAEKDRELQKAINYLSLRNTDADNRMRPRIENTR